MSQENEPGYIFFLCQYFRRDDLFVYKLKDNMKHRGPTVVALVVVIRKANWWNVNASGHGRSHWTHPVSCHSTESWILYTKQLL
jgi:hypothetical protein